MLLIPAFGSQRQVNLCEFEARPGLQELVPGQAPKLQRNLSQKQTNKKKEREKKKKRKIKKDNYLCSGNRSAHDLGLSDLIVVVHLVCQRDPFKGKRGAVAHSLMWWSEIGLLVPFTPGQNG